MPDKDLYKEFFVEVLKDDGTPLRICGLCGNSGEIDTTNSATWNGKSVGVKKCCICPNGRSIKKYYLNS